MLYNMWCYIRYVSVLSHHWWYITFPNDYITGYITCYKKSFATCAFQSSALSSLAGLSSSQCSFSIAVTCYMHILYNTLYCMVQGLIQNAQLIRYSIILICLKFKSCTEYISNVIVLCICQINFQIWCPAWLHINVSMLHIM